jgi:SulP family sulfate permease
MIIVGSGWTITLTVGIFLAFYQAPEGQRSPVLWLTSLHTLKGNQPLHTVIFENFLPACSVALVAIPLSIALGIASGASPMMGLATAVVAGCVAGAFGSSAFNIVGPAGALVGILLRYTSMYGVEVLPWLSLISSAMVVVTIITRLHEYCLFMPKCVFEGFTVGIALTIGLGQLDFALGLAAGPPQHIHGIELSPVMWRLIASVKAIHTFHIPSIVLFVVGVVGMALCYRWKATVPWIVPFTFLCVPFGILCDPDALGLIPIDIPTLQSKYGVSSCWFAQPLTPLPQVIDAASGGGYLDVLAGAGAVAFVGVLETLISAKIASVHAGMDFGIDEELQGLALAHFACGFCGLMPPSGVFVRANVNRTSGCTHKTSHFMHALMVLVLSAIGMRFFSFLPLSAVAAVLVTASIRMTPFAYICSLAERHKRSLGLLLVVAIISFVVDSVVGLAVGTIVALLITAKETSAGHAELSVTAEGGKRNADGSPKMLTIDAMALDNVAMAAAGPKSHRASVVFQEKAQAGGRRTSIAFGVMGLQEGEQTEQGQFASTMTRPQSRDDIQKGERMCRQVSSRKTRVYFYSFIGQVSFLNADKHAERLHAVLECHPHAVVLCMQNVPWIDPDGLDALRMILDMFVKNNVAIYLAGARTHVLERLQKEAWFLEADKQHRVFPFAQLALSAATADISNEESSSHDSSSGLSEDDDDHDRPKALAKVKASPRPEGTPRPRTESGQLLPE